MSQVLKNTPAQAQNAVELYGGGIVCPRYEKNYKIRGRLVFRQTCYDCDERE